MWFSLALRIQLLFPVIVIACVNYRTRKPWLGETAFLLTLLVFNFSYLLYDLTYFEYLTPTANYTLVMGIILHITLHLALFSWLTRLITKKIPNHHIQGIIQTTLLLTMFYLWLDSCSLSLFGSWQGCGLFNPLNAVVDVPPITLLIQYTGIAVALSLFLLLVMALFSTFPVWSVGCLMMVLLLGECWLAPCVLRSEEQEIVPLQLTFPRTNDPARTVRALRNEILVHLESYPNATMVVLPESAIQGCGVLRDAAVEGYLGEDELGDEVNVFSGSFELNNSGDSLFNCFYWLHKECVIGQYAKRSPLPFTEQFTRFLGIVSIQPACVGANECVVPAHNERPRWTLNNNRSFVPYICSELICHTSPDDTFGDTPILAVCNDRWCGEHVAARMVKAAQLRSVAWRRQVVYVSHRYGIIFDPDGTQTMLSGGHPLF